MKSLLTRTLISLLATLFLAIAAFAQTTSITDGTTPTGLTPGAPAGSYPLGDFDSINVFNGNLNFRLPLLKIGGRGSAGYTMTLPIEQKWIIKKGVFNPFTGTYPMAPNPNWWQGIKPGYSPGVLQGRRTGYGDYPGQNYCGQSPPNVFEETLTRLTFTTADGTEYELRDQLTNGTPGLVSSVPCADTGTSRGKVFVSADGSAATFISDTTIYDYKGRDISLSNRLIYPSGYLMLRDGTRYRIDNGHVSWIRDRNGNKVTFNGGTITDSINRTVTVSLDDGARHYDEISYSGFPGYAGGAGRTIRVWYDSLQNRLRSGYSLQTYYQLFPLNSASTATTYNPKRVSKVELPDGRFYQFYYNPYGELARVELPTGGAFEYDWDGITAPDDEVIFRYVIERRVYSDSVTCESKTQYLRNGEVKTYDGTGTYLIGLSKHYFEGDAFLSMIEDPARPSAINFSPWKEGRELKTEVFDIVAGSPVLKKKIEHTWQQPGANSTWPLISGQEETSLLAKPNNPQITETKTTLADTNQVAKQTFKYDRYSNRTDVYEYDFGLVLIRRSHTDFLTTHSSGVDYACNPTTTCGNSASIDNVVHLRSLPTQQQVFDSSGAERSRQTFEYDNYTASTPYAGLVPRSNVSGLCAVVTTTTPCDNSSPASFTRRGNVTTISQHVLGTAVVVNTYSQYDVVGNVVKTINPRGYETTFEYSDVYGGPDGNARLNSAPLKLSQVNEVSYAFPTIITNANLHKVYSQFDYNTGQVVDSEDANGVVTSSYFNDLLERPTQVRRAVATTIQNQTTVTYDDAARSITVSSDRDANNDNILVSKSFHDPLGRTVETRQYEGGTQYIATKKIPFEVVQDGADWRVVSRTSNPYRPNQGEQAVWTTSMSDSMGRTIKVTTPDSASVITAYSGNSVTVTDPAGKARKSVTDALGHLIQVYEDPNGVSHQTTYLYDVLDNLVKVTQGSQQRFFMYDSLKRLIRARNPEQATLPSLNLSDPITSNSAWSIAYQYDSSGNLTQKTDARGVVSTYVFDALNRNTSIDYSDSTPDVFRQFDLAVNGIGRINQTWQSGATTSATNIDSYDALGRPLVQRQRYETAGVWSSSYQTTRTYNLAGAVTSQVYPSGNSVAYTYDAAGRTSSFSGNLGDGGIRTYANNITYSSFGGPGRERFGTNTPLYQKSFYNIRGQLFDTRLSSVNDMWDWNRGRLILYYSSNHLWGQSGTDNNGNVRFAETWIPPENATLDQAETLSEQSYEYDSLNRLKSVAEQRISVSSGWVWQPQSKQTFSYDQYGNRTISTNPTDTWGTGINNRSFEIEAATNRLYSPGDLALAETQRRIRYDAAGNQFKDTYTGYGNASFDAENRITTIQDGLGSSSTYNYSADGQRTRRKINNQETWQIYGFDDELLAEYPANGATASPQKEYGYRNGQLLITAGGVTSGLVGHWKLDENTGTSTVDSSGNGNAGTLSAGAGWSAGQSGSAASLDGVDDYVQVGAQSSLVMSSTASFSAWIYPTGPGSEPNIGGVIVNKEGEYEIVRFPDGTIQMAFANSNPGWNWINTGYVAPLNEWTHVTVTYSNGTVKTYANGNLVHTYNGSGLIGDVVTGQNDFRIGGRQLLSQNFQGRIDEVRVYNRAVTAGEVTELMGAPVSGLKGHWKLNENTGTSAVDSSGNGNAGTLAAGAAWGAGQSGSAVSLDGTDDYVQVGAQPSLVMTSTASFSAWIYPTGPGSMAPYGGIILSKEGEYEIARFTDGTIQWAFANSNPGWAWINTGYVAPLNEWTHLAVTYSNGTIKTYANGVLVHTYNGSGSIGDVVTGLNDFRIGSRQEFLQNFQGRIDDVRVYNRALTAGEASSIVTAGAPVAINWLVADQLGTPRMIVDQTGALANIKRHDYLPFGEELFAPAGDRKPEWGYASGDGIRQQFTAKERDIETGLDFFGARYYSSTQGRFQSVDPYTINLERQQSDDPVEAEKEFSRYISQPQHWNLYSYVLNNPLKFIDPDGWSETNSFTLDLLGEEVTIVVDKKVLKKNPDALAKVKEAITQAFGKINQAHEDKAFTPEQLNTIRRLEKIQVNSNKGVEGMVGNTFHIKIDHATNTNSDVLSGNIMHDARHAEQAARGLSYNENTAIPMEREASSFVLGVIVTRGWSEDSIQGFCRDSKEGHLPSGWKDKSTPQSTQALFDTMRGQRTQ